MIAGVGGEFRRRVARRREQQQRRRDEVEQREVDALAAACPDVPRTRRDATADKTLCSCRESVMRPGRGRRPRPDSQLDPNSDPYCDLDLDLDLDPTLALTFTSTLIRP